MTEGKLKTPNSKLQIWNLEFGIWNLSKGFTLIELLVVITLMAIMGSLATSSYLSFERGARVKNAAQLAKSQVRLAQNYAFSGKVSCTAPAKTAGWVTDFTNGAATFDVSQVCNNAGTVTLSVAETVKLPKSVTISALSAGGTSAVRAMVFYQSQKNSSTFHSSTPINGTGTLINLLASQNDVTVTFSVSSNTYKLEIKPTGEVNEKP